MKGVIILLYVFCILALAIAIYQFTDGRIWDGVLSLIYSSVFLIGAIFKTKN